MAFIIPTQSLPAYSFEIAIDNTPYRLSFKWNSKFLFWTMDIATITGEVIIQGAKLNIQENVLRLYPDPRLPKGAIVTLDTTQKLTTIGRDDLGTNVLLVYVTKDELDDTL